MEGEKDRTTWRDVGRGMMLLGGAALLLTAIFFILAQWEEKYYGLFSGETHIMFYTALGLALLLVGLVLARRGSPKASEPESAEQNP